MSVALMEAETARRAKPAAVLRLGNLVLDQDARTVTVAGATVRFRPTEFHILEMLVAGKGRAVPHDKFRTATARSTKVQVCRIRKRLSAAGADGRISSVWNVGYIAREPG